MLFRLFNECSKWRGKVPFNAKNVECNWNGFHSRFSAQHFDSPTWLQHSCKWEISFHWDNNELKWKMEIMYNYVHSTKASPSPRFLHRLYMFPSQNIRNRLSCFDGNMGVGTLQNRSSVHTLLYDVLKASEMETKYRIRHI